MRDMPSVKFERAMRVNGFGHVPTHDKKFVSLDGRLTVPAVLRASPARPEGRQLDRRASLAAVVEARKAAAGKTTTPNRSAA